jgi:hypothetical protein
MRKIYTLITICRFNILNRETLLKVCDCVNKWQHSFNYQASFYSQIKHPLHQGGYNSQNSQMRSHGNPNLTRVTNFQRRFSVHVWCGLLGKKVTAQFNRWQVLILHEDDLPRQMYFQQDRAPPHYTQDVREYLHKNFSSCLLGCGGPLAQPPRSPDLTTLDFYLWGHMMTLVYERKADSRTVLCHCTLCNSSVHIYKGKVIPLQARCGPEGG